MLLALNVLSQIIPVRNLLFVVSEGHHCECLTIFVARTNVGTVTTTHTVEHAHLYAEVHSCHRLWHLHFECCILEVLHFFFVENEWADTSVRTNVSTLVTLDTIVGSPLGVESLNATFFESRRTICHCTINHIVAHKVRHFQQVARLSIDGAYNFFDVCGNVFFCGNSVISKVCPCWVNSQRLVFATAVNGCIVLINHVLSLIAIRFHNELLHLLDSQVNGDNLCDAEESTLQDGIGAVAQSNLLCNLRSVHIINGDIVLCEVTFDAVGDELNQLFAFEDGVEQESAILLQTANYIVHVQVSLHVACHEVGRVNLIC